MSLHRTEGTPPWSPGESPQKFTRHFLPSALGISGNAVVLGLLFLLYHTQIGGFRDVRALVRSARSLIIRGRGPRPCQE